MKTINIKPGPSSAANLAKEARCVRQLLIDVKVPKKKWGKHDEVNIVELYMDCDSDEAFIQYWLMPHDKWSQRYGSVDLRARSFVAIDFSSVVKVLGLTDEFAQTFCDVSGLGEEGISSFPIQPDSISESYFKEIMEDDFFESFEKGYDRDMAIRIFKLCQEQGIEHITFTPSC